MPTVEMMTCRREGNGWRDELSDGTVLVSVTDATGFHLRRTTTAGEPVCAHDVLIDATDTQKADAYYLCLRFCPE